MFAATCSGTDQNNGQVIQAVTFWSLSWRSRTTILKGHEQPPQKGHKELSGGFPYILLTPLKLKMDTGIPEITSF